MKLLRKLSIEDLLFQGIVYMCILRSPADSDAFQSGRCAEHNGRPESPIIVSYGISNEGAEVVIESGTLVKDVIEKGVLNKQVTFDDPLNAGKIRIIITNEGGTQNLSGAQFEIYAKDGDYTINSVTVNASVNGDANEKAGAVIYVQKSPEEKEAGTWTELKNFEDISTDHTVDFDGQVVGVKVVYTNTLEYFTSGEIVLNVTFANRSETSTENDHEVRRIINQADISWADTYKDRDGNEQERNYNLSSNEVMAEIPTYEAQLPGTNTGDNTAVMPYIILGAVGAGGCIAPGIAYRRKRKVF